MPHIYTHASVTRLRKEAKADAEVVGELPRGTQVEVHERGEQFTRVSVEHAEQGPLMGYVHNSFINDSTPPRPVERRTDPEISCQACGNKEWSTLPMVYTRPGDHASTPILVMGIFSSVKIKARVCLTCGMVHQCLDEEGLEVVRSARR